jgi:hypothetical protein
MWSYPDSCGVHAISRGKAGFEKPLHGYVMWEGEAALSPARIPARTSQHLKRTMSRGCGIRSTLFIMLFSECRLASRHPRTFLLLA